MITSQPGLMPGEQRTEAVRLRRQQFASIHGLDRPEQPRTPDVPIARYDVCTCGHARFMHEGRDQTIAVASEFGTACTGFEGAYAPLSAS